MESIYATNVLLDEGKKANTPHWDITNFLDHLWKPVHKIVIGAGKELESGMMYKKHAFTISACYAYT